MPEIRSRSSLPETGGVFHAHFRALGLACLFTQTAHAETLSEEIARTGLTATEARLVAAASTDPADAFGLGGVQFLRAVEQSYQLRWQTGWPTRPGCCLPAPADGAESGHGDL